MAKPRLETTAGELVTCPVDQVILFVLSPIGIRMFRQWLNGFDRMLPYQISEDAMRECIRQCLPDHQIYLFQEQ